MEQNEVEELKLLLRKFAQERDWEQFHSPKNLSMALSVEASELLEHFQWMTDQSSYALGEAKQQLVSYELADVFIYLLRLCDQLNVDLMSVTKEKMKINNERYPVSKVKGSSKKYTEY